MSGGVSRLRSSWCGRRRGGKALDGRGHQRERQEWDRRVDVLPVEAVVAIGERDAERDTAERCAGGCGLTPLGIQGPATAERLKSGRTRD